MVHWMEMMIRRWNAAIIVRVVRFITNCTRLTSVYVMSWLVKRLVLGRINRKMKFVEHFVAVRALLLRFWQGFGLMRVLRNQWQRMKLLQCSTRRLLDGLVFAAWNFLNRLRRHSPRIVNENTLDKRRSKKSFARVQTRCLRLFKQMQVGSQVGLRWRRPVELSEAPFRLQFKRRHLLGRVSGVLSLRLRFKFVSRV